MASALAAHAKEQWHLLRTYKIIGQKLEAKLRAPEAEATGTRALLAGEVRAMRDLNDRAHAHPSRRTLAVLDELHLSGLDAIQFLLFFSSFSGETHV